MPGLRAAVRVVPAPVRRREGGGVPRLRRLHGEDGDLPIPGEREFLTGRFLLRRPFAPLALQLNLNVAPGGRQARSLGGHSSIYPPGMEGRVSPATRYP